MKLTAQGITFAYGDQKILDDLSLEFAPGELCALFGPNGSGKSTLYRCIMGHLSHSGTVSLDGENLSTLSLPEVSRRIAYVPQHHTNPFPFTVLDIVLMGRTPHLGGVFGPRKQDIAASRSVLEKVGLIGLEDRLFHTLSGGQRQLVLIARALVQDCPVMLLDEPTASLGFGNQMLVWRTIRTLAQEGRTVIVCTHEPNHVMWFCDRALALGRHGILVADGTPKDVLTTDLVAELYPSLGQVTTDGKVMMPVGTLPG